MMKRFLSMLLVLAMILACAPVIPLQVNAAVVASGICGTNVTWTLDDEGLLRISGVGEMYDNDEDHKAPWYHNHREVIENVIIEDGVVNIGDFAFFSCSNLISVTIPNSVTSIGDDAFVYCFSLSSITIPDSVTSIGEYAFYGCNIRSITIPDSITSIGNRVFGNCFDLTNVYYAGSKEQWETISIGKYNDELVNATIYYNYTHAEDNPWEKYLTWEVVDGGVTITACDESISGDITIPDTLGGYPVTSIGDCAFAECSSLTSVVIGDSVTSIGDSAFGNCIRLTSVTIGNGVTSIGDNAFYDCSLTSVEIPDSVTSIGDNAFFGCSLTSVVIPDSVTSSVNGAFSYCSKLTSVTIGNSVTSIGDHAFFDCSSLTSVTIPDSVTSIDWAAFDGCRKLKDVYYAGTQEQWNVITIGTDNNDLTDATIHYNHTHDYTLIQPVVVAPTCTQKGGTQYTCAYGDTYMENVTPSLGHDYSGAVTVVEPTCTEKGYTVTQCIRCTETKISDYTAALGHNCPETETTKEPTCTEKGSSVGQCTRCEKTITSSIAALGHKMVVVPAKEPTCTENGLTVGTKCERCDFVGVAQTFVPCTGHDYGEWIPESAPDCENTGLKAHYMCTQCDEYFDEDKQSVTYEDLIIPANGHDYGNLIAKKPASCTENGLKAYYQCSACSKYFDADKNAVAYNDLAIPAGHTYGSLIPEIPATCTKTGVKCHYCCIECGKYFDENKNEAVYEILIIPATGHCVVNGVCCGCGLEAEAVVKQGNSETYFKTFQDAVAAVTDGTIVLLDHITVGNMIINPGVTLDLNGHTLTANIVLVMDGATILDGGTACTGGGKLQIAEKSLAFVRENGQDIIPVWNGVDGYVFTKVTFQQMAVKAGAGAAQYIFLPTFSNAEAAALMADGGTDNGLKFKVGLTWSDGQCQQFYTYSDDLVKQVFDGTGKWVFSLTITGISGITDMVANAIVVTDSGTQATNTSTAIKAG